MTRILVGYGVKCPWGVLCPTLNRRLNIPGRKGERKMSECRLLKVLFLSALIFIFIAGPVFAGAWTREKGGLYMQATGNMYTADENFDRSGSKEDFPNDGEFNDANLSIYLEYGLSDDLTAIGSWSYKWLEYEDDVTRNETDGFSDLEVGMKYRLFEKKGGVGSIQAMVKIPEAYDEDDSVPLGNAQYDYEFRFLYGQSLYPHFPGYLNLEAGYRFRAERPADEFKYLLEFGADFTKRFYGRMKLDGTYGMGNAGKGSAFSDNPSATYDYDLGKLEAVAGFKISDKWGTELGWRKEIYGKNISAGENWSLAVTYQAP